MDTSLSDKASQGAQSPVDEVARMRDVTCEGDIFGAPTTEDVSDEDDTACRGASHNVIFNWATPLIESFC